MRKIAVQVGRKERETRDHRFFVVVQYIADHLQRYEEYVHPYKRGESRGFQRFRRKVRLFSQARTGVSLVLLYLFIKILYIVNLVLQICFLQYFLSYHDVNYIRYGISEVLGHLFSGFSLPESRLFPRITLCDFQIRELGERHQYNRGMYSRHQHFHREDVFRSLALVLDFIGHHLDRHDQIHLSNLSASFAQSIHRTSSRFDRSQSDFARETLSHASASLSARQRLRPLDRRLERQHDRRR